MTIALATIPSRVNDGFYCETLLQDPDGQIDALVERYHSRSLSRLLCKNAAENINRGNGLLIYNYEPLPEPKINQLVIPTGATRWSYCLLLVDDTKKNLIYTACSNGETPMNLIYGSKIAEREEDKHIITLTGYCLPPRRISPETTEVVNNLWIIPFVDERYLWQFQSTGTISTSMAGYETADEIVEGAIDTTGTFKLNVGVCQEAYTKFPVCRNTNDYENLPIYVDSIAAHFGQRVVPDIVPWDQNAEKYKPSKVNQPSSGTTRYALIDGTNSKSVYENNLLGKQGLMECVWSTGTGQEGVLVTPAGDGTVVNGEPVLVAGGKSSSPTSQFALVPSSVDIQTISGTYVNKTPGIDYKTLSATAIWRTEYDEEPPAIQITQIAKDYYLQWYYQYDYTFAGVQPWQQGYFDDYMVLRQTWNPATGTYDAFTRVCSRLPNNVGEWIGQPQASGTNIISFGIVSADPVTRSAQVEIRQRTFDGPVYGAILNDEVVTVYDTDGCYLNEPNVELTGRLGKAVLMKVDDEAAETHFSGEYDPPEWYWNVMSICCPSTICETDNG